MAKTYCDGKVIFVMEGGYDLETLAYGMCNIAHALLGESTITDPLGRYEVREPEIRGLTDRIKALHQLERCADGYFELVEEVDGTEDYLLTSEEWVRRLRRAVLSPRILKIAIRSIPLVLRTPRQLLTLLMTVFLSDSWNWQFRPPHPPTRLLRQTWSYCPR